jgi:4-carboxymuconolactone decarboxylase
MQRLLLSAVLLLTTAIAFAQEPAKPKLVLAGDRFPGLTYEELTSAQKVIADRALAGRGAIGIFNITLRSPELSDAMRGIISSRTPPLITAKQNELAILLAARYWNAQFEFLVHHRVGARAGLSEQTIADIIEGKRPAALDPDEAPVYNFVTEVLNTKHVSDANFQAAKEALGEKRIVDIIGLVGFYQTGAMMMNTDRYPLGGQKPDLQPLAAPLPVSSGTASTPQSGERFKPLTPEEMTPAQKNLMDLLVSGKIEGGTRGPVNILLRSPDIGEAILRYGAYERFHTPLPIKLNELAALITIRHWTSQFPWYAHHRAAKQAGLSEAVIAAIAEGTKPAGLQPDEQAVYNFCTELLRATQVSDATFNTIKQQLGERGVVEIMGVMGYYQTVSMLVNIDRYPLPDGATPELKPL